MDLQKITECISKLNETILTPETKILVNSLQQKFINDINAITKTDDLEKYTEKVKFLCWLRSNKVNKERRDIYFTNEKYYDEFFKTYIVLTENPGDIVFRHDLLTKFSTFLRKKHDIILTDSQVHYGVGKIRHDKFNLLCHDLVNLYLYRNKGLLTRSSYRFRGTKSSIYIRMQILQP